MAAVDVAEVGGAKRRQERVEHLPDPRGVAPVAGDGAVSGLVGQEAGVHAGEGERDKGKGAHDYTRPHEERGARGRIPCQDEGGVADVARWRRLEAARTRQLGAKRMAKALALGPVVAR